ncbi:scavenger receptor cysteine-rich type 1 protein M130-like [Lepisosteus oculatus]|uniref:scavenger receptor cysteine-rich type 1 protein M130-like n=1 Tax=Lepisosteus oculatus TaxID=7918 RepID=UPI0035F50C3C
MVFFSLSTGSADVRLVNGASPCEGTVEIHYKGEWGAVRSIIWDLDDATVVCRQLGCGSAISAPGGSHFGPGSGSVLLGLVSCRGSESALRHCRTTEVKHYAPSHKSDAGVICSGVRLVGGSNLCSGRVEVQHGETWGSVCDSDFDWQDAEVVCRQLGCGIPSQMLKGGHFGKGGGQVWTEEFQCQGNESQVFSCPKSSTKSQNCPLENNVGLVCFGYTEFRLVNGSDSCSGRVELQWLFKDWGTVCDLYWDLRDATVLCQQLGCIPSSSVPSSVTPDQHSLRLVGGGSDCAGRLEVYHNGSWGTVCDDSWDLADSQVVCRQLQCGTTLSAPVPASFSQGTGPIWLDEVGCLGNESSLWECPSAGWGQHDCGHKEDVGVVCSEFKELRLAEGCSGQLEVFYNGTWGNVCSNSMSEDTVSLICQELNCGKSGHFIDSAPRRDSAPYWLDEFKCRPHDSTLWHCPSSAWNHTQCTDSKVALITCSGKDSLFHLSEGRQGLDVCVYEGEGEGEGDHD